MPEVTAWMVVAIVFIVTVGRVLRARYGDTGRRGRRAVHIDGAQGLVRIGDHDDAESERLRAEVTRLNERIQVLERLATDPAKRLADEIDQLDRK